MLKSLRIILFASLTVMVATGTTGSRPLSRARFQDMGVIAPMADDPLSVMTYNVRGLPWPIAWGRADALAQIGDRLAALRRAGRQPHILLLQEAFTPEARAIAARAGYAHVVAGPDRRMRGPAPGSAQDRAYLARARWDRGEAADKQFGSGLLILSDYPILSAARLAFPAHACAGFDCLANKGALVARLAVPGMAQPVHVVNTHLNARKAAGVPIARSQRAFERQVDLLTRFVRAQVPEDAPLILGGDMNIGRDPARQRAFFDRWANAGMGFVAPQLSGARRAQAPLPQEQAALAATAERGKDWLFARDGAGRPMTVAQARVPFGAAPDTALSDHVGYMLRYAQEADRVTLAGLAAEARP